MNCPIPDSNPDSSTAADVSGRQKLLSYVNNAVERYQKLLEFGLPKGPPKGLSTGFSLLDGMCHGLEPGRVYVIASRPSLGKSTLLLNIIAAVCLNQKTPSLFFSGDLTIPQIVDRLIFNQASAPLSALFDPEYVPTKGDLQRIQKCALELVDSGLVLDDRRDMMIEAIAAKAREERAKNGIGLIAIDHLHLIRSEATRPDTSRKREMAAVIGEIKSLAKELELPVLVSAQLKRRADWHLPRIGDIRQATAIEHEADFVGLLHKEVSDEDCVKLLIAKNNNGPLGTVRLFLSAELQRFEQGPVVYHEENEMERAWRDYRLEKDFPHETA
jgi:replicative DNA helicase